MQLKKRVERAKISPEALAVYDDEVTVALPKVLSWLKKIAEEN